MFVVMRLMKWDSVEVTIQPFHLPLSVSDLEDNRTLGFLPVFETREQAEAWAEDGKYPIQEVRETVQAGVPG